MNWDHKFFELAKHISTWSKDPGTKVGAVIVGVDNDQFSFGYNGFVRGADDSILSFADRETKLRNTVHAEMNAILNSSRNGMSTKKCKIYTTFPPCFNCALGIIQAGISAVFTTPICLESRWAEQMNEAKNLLCSRGVEYGVLKAYGNVIVPQAATEFIKAVMDL